MKKHHDTIDEADGHVLRTPTDLGPSGAAEISAALRTLLADVFALAGLYPSNGIAEGLGQVLE